MGTHNDPTTACISRSMTVKAVSLTSVVALLGGFGLGMAIRDEENKPIIKTTETKSISLNAMDLVDHDPITAGLEYTEKEFRENTALDVCCWSMLEVEKSPQKMFVDMLAKLGETRIDLALNDRSEVLCRECFTRTISENRSPLQVSFWQKMIALDRARANIIKDAEAVRAEYQRVSGIESDPRNVLLQQGPTITKALNLITETRLNLIQEYADSEPFCIECIELNSTRLSK